MSTKTRDDHFRDWMSSLFGFGYGTGEAPILTALHRFLSLCSDQGSYDYKTLQDGLTPTVAWLLINALCGADILTYGTSSRYGWLTDEGKALKAYVIGKTVDELWDMVVNHDENTITCMPDACNCGPNGYEAGRVCDNPFWKRYANT